ncbi:MAG: F0F1 ATP synthase subunit epsilon [Gammaproteobacteria bacterium]|nr:F0F1 ATP synthase subunit epsilon [Gammaproteobacteria bacterium]
MRLRIVLPTEIVLDTEVYKIVAEAQNGSFCLLPRHVDFVAALVPGVLSYWPAGQTDPRSASRHAAVDEGILVKTGGDVLVSSLDAVLGTDLDLLQQAVQQRFQMLDEEQRIARAALARLEAGALRHLYDLERSRHE